jgi:hypothetical protein
VNPGSCASGVQEDRFLSFGRSKENQFRMRKSRRKGAVALNGGRAYRRCGASEFLQRHGQLLSDFFIKLQCIVTEIRITVGKATI